MSGNLPAREGENPPDRASGGPTWLQRGALAYMILCLCALLFLYQLLEERGAGDWSFFPVVVGTAGVFLRWGLAPLFLIGSVALAGLVETNRFLFHSSATLRLPDLLLCSAVLGYAMAHFRLTSIDAPFPPEKTEAKKKPERPDLETLLAPDAVRRGQPESPFIPAWELGILLLSLPLWVGLAQLAWLTLPHSWGNPGIVGPIWRTILFLWVVGGLGLAMASVLDYWRRRSMSVEEATLFLQDTLWRETRGEQRRINRWYAWARVRSRHPSFWQDAKANRRILFVILIVDLLFVLFILGRMG